MFKSDMQFDVLSRIWMSDSNIGCGIHSWLRFSAQLCSTETSKRVTAPCPASISALKNSWNLNVSLRHSLLHTAHLNVWPRLRHRRVSICLLVEDLGLQWICLFILVHLDDLCYLPWLTRKRSIWQQNNQQLDVRSLLQTTW